MNTQTATYSIPVSALADGFPASTWRRENPSAPVPVPVSIPVQPVFQPAPAQAAGTVLFSVGQSIEHVEREMIAKTMHATRGNRTRAAKLLGISVRTLYTKLRMMEVSERMSAGPVHAQPKSA